MPKKEEEIAKTKSSDAAPVVEPSDLFSEKFSVTPEEQEVLKLAMLSPVNVNVRYDRKINMGNFESLGVGIGVTMPVGLSEEQYEIMGKMCRRAIDEANKVSATETNEKVRRIKARKRGEESND